MRRASPSERGSDVNTKQDDSTRRILQVVERLDYGWAETIAVASAAQKTDDLTIDFLVAGASNSAFEKLALGTGGKVFHIDSIERSGVTKFVNNTTKVIKQHKYDVVHSHLNLASGFVMRAAYRADAPVRIAHSHLDYEPSPALTTASQRTIARLLVRDYATALVACNDDSGARLFEDSWQQFDGNVVSNGIDLDLFRPASEQRIELRAAWGLTESDFAVGMVSRLEQDENPDFLLEVLAADRALAANAVLFYLGDGSQRKALTKKAEKLGLTDRVRFLGAPQDLPNMLCALDRLVVPTAKPGLPITLIQAQAVGLPALVADQIDHRLDLGLGLVEFLPADNPNLWQANLRHSRPEFEPAQLHQAVSDHGFDVSASVGQMLELY